MIKNLEKDDGAIEFWRLTEYFRNDLVQSQHWSDEKWKSTMAKGGGNKKRFQYCIDSSGAILYFRALQGHSGRNLIDPSLHDNVLIPDDFLEFIFARRMCNQFTLHHDFRIDTRRTKIEQKTDGIIYVCGSYEQRPQRSARARFDQTTSCIVQAEKVEKAPRYGVLGRYTACSTERI